MYNTPTHVCMGLEKKAVEWRRNTIRYNMLDTGADARYGQVHYIARGSVFIFCLFVRNRGPLEYVRQEPRRCIVL